MAQVVWKQGTTVARGFEVTVLNGAGFHGATFKL